MCRRQLTKAFALPLSLTFLERNFIHLLLMAPHRGQHFVCNSNSLLLIISKLFETRLRYLGQLYGAAAEYFESIPLVTSSNVEALVSTLETSCGSHLDQLFLTQLKRVRQGQRDLQRLAAYVDSLSRKALSGCATITINIIDANTFVDTVADNHVPRFVRHARPRDVSSAITIALEVETVEHSQSADCACRQAFMEPASMARHTAPSGRLLLVSPVLKCYRCSDSGHFARHYRRVFESSTNSATAPEFPFGYYNAGRRGQDSAYCLKPLSFH
ncbi:hypothetical protein HPB49_014510 [Dermacentor silvarum]|uniref:Uncharacterized protein n=1 Tax=Dermacentor silvarum TaxID=543639 RepID=A0ACB8D624_DERSI|nr:hypothetical protein HPB49_014510 [Dermacentor silvarum]